MTDQDERKSVLEGTGLEHKKIYQANELIEAQMSMSINELRLMHLSLLKTDPQLGKITDEEGKTFPLTTIEPENIVKLFGTGNESYNKIKLAAKKLMNKQINIEDRETREFVYRNIYSSIGFSAKRGGLKFRFAEDMKPYVYQLADNFTKIAGELSFLLSSPYSVRLIQWLLRLQGVKGFEEAITRTMTIEQIRAMLLLDGKKFARQNDFMNRVIKTAVNDINESTDYRIDYDEIRSGKTITSLKFILHIPRKGKVKEEIAELLPMQQKAVVKKAGENANAENPNADLIALLVSHGVGKIVAKKLVDNPDITDERIRANIKYALGRTGIKRIGAYIRRAIEDDYASSIDNQSGSLFCVDNSNNDYIVGRLKKMGFGKVSANMLVGIVDKHERFGATEKGWCEKSGIDADMLYDAIKRHDFSAFDTIMGEVENVVTALPNKDQQEAQYEPVHEELTSIIAEDMSIDSDGNGIETLKKEFMSIILSNKKVNMEFITRAAELGADLSKYASAVGKNITDCIEI